jgi:acetyl-CoA C-acetyltransferase
MPAAEPRLHRGGHAVSTRPCAVVGVGQTHHKSRRLDVSFGGLVREAVFRALDDARMTMADIDAVILGKAPDLFEGVMKPELYLSDALGAVGKPMFRVHTAGSVGGTTAIVAASHIQVGKHRTVLAVAFEKQSEGNAQFALGSGRGASLGAGGAFAPFIRAYIHRSRAPEHIGWKVAVKDRLNALKNPYAHLRIEDISIEKVKASPMMWEPIRFLESCPSSDGACAMVLTDEQGGDAAAADGRPPAWILGASSRSEPASFPGRDPVRPAAALQCAADVYNQAGITDPRRQIDTAELYVPFSWHEPIWLEAFGLADEGDGWKLVEDGTTELGGSLPINASGGVLSSNPIGASGLLRFAEAANQVRGAAGEHQVDGAKVAIGMAYGANSQYFSTWAVGRSLQPFG